MTKKDVSGLNNCKWLYIDICAPTYALDCTSLPFNVLTLAKRAIKANLAIPPLFGSVAGLSEHLTSWG